MSGTVSGGKKVVETRVQKYMDQGWSEIVARKMVSDDYRRIGAIGGSVKGTKGGFAADNGIARTAGATGGKYSRRGHKLVKRYDTYGVYIDKSSGETVRINYV